MERGRRPMAGGLHEHYPGATVVRLQQQPPLEPSDRRAGPRRPHRRPQGRARRRPARTGRRHACSTSTTRRPRLEASRSSSATRGPRAGDGGRSPSWLERTPSSTPWRPGSRGPASRIVAGALGRRTHRCSVSCERSPVRAPLRGWLQEWRSGAAEGPAPAPALIQAIEDLLDQDPQADGAALRAWLSTGGNGDGFGRDDDAVALLTFHAAKGLEWPTVIVIGVVRGPGASRLGPQRGRGGRGAPAVPRGRHPRRAAPVADVVRTRALPLPRRDGRGRRGRGTPTGRPAASPGGPSRRSCRRGPTGLATGRGATRHGWRSWRSWTIARWPPSPRRGPSRSRRSRRSRGSAHSWPAGTVPACWP